MQSIALLVFTEFHPVLSRDFPLVDDRYDRQEPTTYTK